MFYLCELKESYTIYQYTYSKALDFASRGGRESYVSKHYEPRALAFILRADIIFSLSKEKSIELYMTYTKSAAPEGTAEII